MATEPLSRVILPRHKITRPLVLSARVMAFIMGWLFGWPLLIYAYNPLAAPYDPLTLFIVVPGGAMWVYLFARVCVYGYETVFAMAEARWPAAKTIREILEMLPRLVFYIVWSLLP